MTTTLSVGIARADVTPPVSIKSAGFATRGPLVRHHDPLLATALVFADGDQRAALVSCDLLDLDTDTVGEIRSRTHERTGIPETAITLTCTHTHYGPNTHPDGSDPVVQTYHDNLVHTLVGVIEAAAAVRVVEVG